MGSGANLVFNEAKYAPARVSENAPCVSFATIRFHWRIQFQANGVIASHCDERSTQKQEHRQYADQIIHVFNFF